MIDSDKEKPFSKRLKVKCPVWMLFIGYDSLNGEKGLGCMTFDIYYIMSS